MSLEEIRDESTGDAPLRPLVMVADDDAVTRAIVGTWLGSEGYGVIAARDGGEALQIAAESHPDLLLVDVTMPGLDGYDVCRAIQAASHVAPPLIFLTANGRTSARVAGLEAGAVDYVVKPFERAELIARVRSALRMKALRDGFVEKAARDGLTGLLNREELDSRAEAAVSLARRHDRQLSCLMVDIDHFKPINDQYGHAAGDAVLRMAAERITSVCRLSDVVGRYGGEEFILLLPEAGADDARSTADRLRRVLADSAVVHGAESIPVTASVGVAALQPGMATAVSLYAAADRALYRAKELGRNRTELDPA